MTSTLTLTESRFAGLWDVHAGAETVGWISRVTGRHSGPSYWQQRYYWQLNGPTGRLHCGFADSRSEAARAIERAILTTAGEAA